MKEFLRLLRRFVPPYKKYLIGALFLNLLSAILNIFSFALIIPILQILFKMDTKTYEFIPWDAVGVNLKAIAVNNFYYYVTELIASQGESLFQFCFFGGDDSPSDGGGSRYPRAGIKQVVASSFEFLLRRAEGRHHCPHER